MQTEKLFSYGTLRYENVQILIFGRKLLGTPDILGGYFLSEIEIIESDIIKKSGEVYHPIAIFTGDKKDYVEGFVFELTLAELEKADLYEVSEYKRTKVQLNSGIWAWAYVRKNKV